MRKKTLTRSDLYDSLSKNLNLSRPEAKCVLESVLEQIAVGLAKDGQAKMTSFGTFHAKERISRVGRNPKTGEKVIINPCKSLSFKASSDLKSAVNQGLRSKSKKGARKSVKK